jgi:Ni/Fe-hydrogenase subunit HybB-like protein
MSTQAAALRRLYWALVTLLLGLVATGASFYARQLAEGLQITGLSRDVPWGLYISQFTFLVGVAASGVMVALPYYLHHYQAFGKLAVLAESLAVTALSLCMLFVFVDIGQPARVLNVLLNPAPRSLMFWDMMVVGGYLLLNVVLLRSTLVAERCHVPPPAWTRLLVFVSIPCAFAIHTVTALLYAGLAARPAWMTAILAPRFLASAFASGPALLILLGLLLRRTQTLDVGQRALDKLAEIVAYAMTANVFFVVLEVFTALYSGIPEDSEQLRYLYAGLEGHAALVGWAYTSALLGVVALVALLVPRARRHRAGLVVACLAVVGSVWVDKGLCMVTSGFVPTPLGRITDYAPTGPEISIATGIYSIGLLMLLLGMPWILARCQQQATGET